MGRFRDTRLAGVRLDRGAVAMSVINQVLNDLEKRGANIPLHEAVRAVPVPSKSARWVYAGVAIILLMMVIAWGWSMLDMHHETPLPVTVLSSKQVVGARTVSQVAPVPQTIAVEQTAASPVVIAASSVSLAAANGTQEKPVAASAVTVAEVVPTPVAVQTAATVIRKSPPTSVSKVPKVLTPRQRAEGELRRGRQLAQSGQVQEAVAAYEKALSIDPAYFMARDTLVSALLESKRNADAERILQDGLLQDRSNSRFAMLLARLQVERNDLPLALETLGKTLPYAEQQPDYQAFMAALLQRLDRHVEAITHYRIALQRSPDSGLWLMGLGISLQAVQRKEEAREAYNRAIATRGLSPELHEFVMRQLHGL
jgi:MSHA biogenesis protein MshN